MRSGADKSDDYLEDWRRGDPISCTDMLEKEVDNLANQIEQLISVTELQQFDSKWWIHKATIGISCIILENGNTIKKMSKISRRLT